jgi:hypothetical protein
MKQPNNDGGGGEQDGVSQDSFYLPKDFPGADGFKPGDRISLIVVGKDEEGDLEVKPGSQSSAKPEEGEKPELWDGLDEHMTANQPEEM